MVKDNVSVVVHIFLKKIGVKVTFNTVCRELLRHPNFPSFFAIQQVLESWNIPSAAYNVTKEDLSKVPTPFITTLARKNSEFTVVDSLTADEVVISDELQKSQKISRQTFDLVYQGAVFVAEREESSGELDFKTKRRAELQNFYQLPFTLAAIICVFGITALRHAAFFSNITFNTAVIFSLKSLGVFVSCLLLVQSLDSNNSFIKQICSTAKNMNCNAILSSSAAKSPIGFSWSEIGFFYFAGTLLVVLFYKDSAVAVSLLALLNLLCLPYTIYSIYYQWQIAKQWCILCCTVQAILWMEFAAFVPSLLTVGWGQIIGVAWLDVFLLMLIPILGWLILKPLFTAKKEVGSLQRNIQKFRYNSVLFDGLMTNEVSYKLLDDADSIILGNKEAKLVVTIVTNPYCPPCAKAHESLDEWLDYREDLKLQLIIPGADEKDILKSTIACHLMKLRSSETLMRTALNKWYSQKSKDYEQWSSAFPVSSNNDFSTTFQKQQAGCDMVGIEETPTIFINGRRVPSIYEPSDIKYLI